MLSIDPPVMSVMQRRAGIQISFLVSGDLGHQRLWGLTGTRVPLTPSVCHLCSLLHSFTHSALLLEVRWAGAKIIFYDSLPKWTWNLWCLVSWDVRELDSVLGMTKGLSKRDILEISWLSVVTAGMVPRRSLETPTTMLVLFLATAKAGASLSELWSR